MLPLLFSRVNAMLSFALNAFICIFRSKDYPLVDMPSRNIYAYMNEYIYIRIYIYIYIRIRAYISTCRCTMIVHLQQLGLAPFTCKRSVSNFNNAQPSLIKLIFCGNNAYLLHRKSQFFHLFKHHRFLIIAQNKCKDFNCSEFD